MRYYNKIHITSRLFPKGEAEHMKQDVAFTFRGQQPHKKKLKQPKPQELYPGGNNTHTHTHNAFLLYLNDKY